MPILPTNRLVKFLALFCGSGFLLLLLISPLTSHAAFNQQINYQGKLTNASGVAVPDASYTMVFKLYDAATGGTTIWTETDTVTTQGGLFSLMLGSTTPFTGVNFNQALYLGLTINSDAEMTPRKVLGAVTSSFTSLHLDGNASSTIIDVTSYLNVTGTTTSSAYCIGTDCINSWGTVVSPWTDDGTNLTPTAAGRGLVINGTSTLATTTMAYNSKIGTASSYLTVEAFDLYGLVSSSQAVPLIRFNSNFPFGSQYGAIADALIIAQSDPAPEGSSGPQLIFMPNTFSGGNVPNIAYSTSSKSLDVNNVNLLTLNGMPLYVSSSTATSTFTGNLQVAGNSILATTTFGNANYGLTLNSQTFGPFNFETLKFNNSDLGGSYGAIEGHLALFDTLDSGTSNDNPSIMFASRSFDNEANITFATTSNQLEFRDSTHYYFRDGSVGINTENPSGAYKLLVTGDSYFNGSSTVTGFTRLATTTLTNLANTYLAVDGNGMVVATTTPTSPSGTSDWLVSGGKLTPTSTLDILATANIEVPTGSAYKYNGVNLAYGSTTLENYFFGKAGALNMTGVGNTAVGSLSLSQNTTGFYNTAMGFSSLISNLDGVRNSAFGNGALGSNTSGNSNVAIGEFSLSYALTTTGMTAIGTNAGMGSGGLNDYNSVIDTYGTFIGYQASRNNNIASTSVLNNATAIGYNAKVGASNALVLGGLGTDAVSVGIGTSTPNAYLNVYGNYTDLTATRYGQKYDNYFSPSANTAYDQYGSYLNTIATSSSNFTGNVAGLASYVNHYGSGTASALYGLVSGINNYGSGTVTNAYGLYLASTTGAVTNNYGIYQAGTGMKNSFAGQVGIGTSTPLETLDVFGNIQVNSGSAYKYD
ncbi:MAG: hypothetical protein WC537_02285, partial [Candidatus Paceibacterota bacterium]